jgi:multisubunit Na+/H+ antiporter MnhC subunit
VNGVHLATDTADLWGAGACVLIGVWLIVRRNSWGREVMGIQVFGRAAPAILVVVGSLFVLAALWLLVGAVSG